jgi:hypothetical protein
MMPVPFRQVVGGFSPFQKRNRCDDACSAAVISHAGQFRSARGFRSILPGPDRSSPAEWRRRRPSAPCSPALLVSDDEVWLATGIVFIDRDDCVGAVLWNVRFASSCTWPFSLQPVLGRVASIAAQPSSDPFGVRAQTALSEVAMDGRQLRRPTPFAPGGVPPSGQ